MISKFETPIPRKTIEQLLEEIMALLNSSHIPAQKIPQQKSVTGPISEKVGL
jgi:hypothetical protein